MEEIADAQGRRLGAGGYEPGGSSAGLQTELLAFWGRYPCGKFTISAICCALDRRRLEVRRSLAELVEEDLLVAETLGDLTLYSLATGSEVRNRVIQELSRGDTTRPRRNANHHEGLTGQGEPSGSAA